MWKGNRNNITLLLSLKVLEILHKNKTSEHYSGGTLKDHCFSKVGTCQTAPYQSINQSVNQSISQSITLNKGNKVF